MSVAWFWSLPLWNIRRGIVIFSECCVYTHKAVVHEPACWWKRGQNVQTAGQTDWQFGWRPTETWPRFHWAEDDLVRFPTSVNQNQNQPLIFRHQLNQSFAEQFSFPLRKQKTSVQFSTECWAWISLSHSGLKRQQKEHHLHKQQQQHNRNAMLLSLFRPGRAKAIRMITKTTTK